MITKDLEKVLIDAKNKSFRIPDFQRDFVWKNHNTENLIDSLLRGYPIGSFLFLSCANKNLNLKYTDINIRGDIFTKNKILDNDFYYILDGQQRITSLSRAFLNGDEQYLYCINLNNLYNFFYGETANDDLLVESIKKQTKYVPLKPHLLPLNYLFEDDYDNTACTINDFFSQNSTISIDSKKIESFKNKCLSNFSYLKKYQLSIEILDKSTPLDSIIRIFETINNSGVKLSIFDLMVAKTYYKNENYEFNLKDKLSEIQKMNYLKDLSGATILAGILYLKQLESSDYIISTKSLILNLTRDDIELHMPIFIKNFQEVEEFFITNKIKHSSDLLLIKLMLAISNCKYQIFKKNIPHYELKKFIIFRISQNLVYNRTTINEDINAFKNIFLGENFKKSFINIIKFEKITVDEILNINTKSKEFEPYMCIFHEKTISDLNGEHYLAFSSEKHHVIPDSHIKTVFNKHDKEYFLKDSISNFVWVTKNTNISISNSSPEKYFINLHSKHGDNIFEIFKDNQIPIKSLEDIKFYFENKKSYSVFLKKRANLLSILINNYFKDYLIN